jgi:hypothetical protein
MLHKGQEMKVSLYARVSTALEGQNPENQLIELRRYSEVRGWVIFREYVDRISGSKESRPALNQLLFDPNPFRAARLRALRRVLARVSFPFRSRFKPQRPS